MPKQWRRYSRQFTLALIDTDLDPEAGLTHWKCPACDHRWTTKGVA